MERPCSMTLFRFQKLDQHAKGIAQIKTADSGDRSLGDRRDEAGELAATSKDALNGSIEILHFVADVTGARIVRLGLTGRAAGCAELDEFEMGTVAEQVRDLQLGAGHAGERRNPVPPALDARLRIETHHLGPKADGAFQRWRDKAGVIENQLF